MKLFNFFTHKLLVLSLGLLFSTMLFTACDDDDTPVDNTIIGVASSNPNFSLLVQAIVKADLVSDLSGGPFTVLAPTNAAFEAAGFDAAAIAALPDGDAGLRSILLYHVLSGSLSSTAITSGTQNTLNSGNSLIYFNKNANDEILINGEVEVIQANVNASNGVIHAVGSVILPPSTIAEKATAISDAATGNEGFSILLAALTRSGIDLSTLTGPLTLFAPNDQAFIDSGLDLATVNSLDAGTLAAVLQYHVVEGGRTFSSDLVSDLSVSAADGNGLYFGIGTSGVFVNEAQITGTDILTTDGVIHVVDKVIGQGTITDLVANNPEFASLLGAVGAADADANIDVAGALSNTSSNLTLFAPDNAAFASLLAELQISDLSGFSTDEVETILLYHVLGAEVFASGVSNGVQTTLASQDITLAVDMMNGGVTITDQGNRTSTVTNVNINLANGVVHVIDTVLVPALAE